MRDRITYAMVSWSPMDVLEIAADMEVPMTDADAQALLCEYETAIYDAGYYAQKQQIQDVLNLRKEREVK